MGHLTILLEEAVNIVPFLIFQLKNMPMPVVFAP